MLKVFGTSRQDLNDDEKLTQMKLNDGANPILWTVSSKDRTKTFELVIDL